MDDDVAVARRRILLGAGATALVAASLRGADGAEAKPKVPEPEDTILTRSGGTARVAAQRSSPLSGYTYRGVSFADFHPVEQNNW